MLLIKNPELLGAFRRGDKAALEVVYRHYVKGVSHFVQKGFSFRSADRFLFFQGFRSAFDLHNVVQEVFRRAFEEKARLSYNGVSSYANWILAIARNLIINQFRNKEIPFSQFEERKDADGGTRTWENQLTDEYSGVFHGSTGEHQDIAMEKAQLKELIERFMAGLNDEDRELVKFRYREGLGQEEAARAMQSTRMKVRTQESRVRRRLIAFLRNTGYLEQFIGAAREDSEEITETRHLGDIDDDST